MLVLYIAREDIEVGYLLFRFALDAELGQIGPILFIEHPSIDLRGHLEGCHGHFDSLVRL